jgi:hypothetical protein
MISMIVLDSVTQRVGKSNRDLLSQVLQAAPVGNIDAAVAYVTTGGAQDLIGTMKQALGQAWPNVVKRWLVGFDYCRTEPLAIGTLLALPNSRVRVPDADRVLIQKCIPKWPFHPKTFLFSHGTGRHAVFTGSGNASRSGLNTGHEVGVLLEVRPPLNAASAPVKAQIDAIQSWFDASWNAAQSVTPARLNRYRLIYESTPQQIHPTFTDDDSTSSTPTNQSLSGKDLAKLRACTNLWVEAGNITPNLGKNQPGNQLMMKRLTRVFFGVPATDVPQNSPLTIVEITFNGISKPDCSLTFSDNGMDKLTLPIPSAGGPPKYDNETLLFTRVKPGTFRLEIGTPIKAAQWLKRSNAISAAFKMTGSGRQWGVF